MPKIRWTNLPPSLRQHLFDRVADRQIPAEDLYKLKLWRESEPEAPDGPWYKDFGSFKICGEGEFPKTFLLKGQPAKGGGPVTSTSRHCSGGRCDVVDRRGEDPPNCVVIRPSIRVQPDHRRRAWPYGFRPSRSCGRASRPLRT